MGVGGKCHAPAVLTPGKTRYRRLGRPWGRSGWVQKISPPPGFDPQTVPPPLGFDPQTVRPVASRWQLSYTLSITLCHFKPQEVLKNILTQDLISSCNCFKVNNASFVWDSEQVLHNRSQMKLSKTMGVSEVCHWFEDDILIFCYRREMCQRPHYMF